MAYTWPSPVAVGASAAEALNATTHTRTQIPYLGYGVSPSSSPTLRVQQNRADRAILEAADAALRLKAVDEGSLAIGVYPGHYRKSDGTDVEFLGSTGFALTDDQTNSVYILHSTGAVTKSTSGFPADTTTFTPIAAFVAASGDITTSDADADRRQLALYQANATVTSPTGTTGTTFTIDSDNAGAEVDQELMFNRGSTDAEDAAIQWDASDDRFNFFTQDTTETLAPINVESVQVAGTDVIDSSGDLAAASIAADQLYTFGANQTTAYGIKLTATAISGAPVANAHTVGELSLDQDDVVWLCITAGTPGTWKRIGDASFSYHDDLVQVSIADDSGATPLDCSVQMKDREGNNLSEACYVQIGIYNDVGGAADSTNATIDNTPKTGSFIRWVTTNKVGIYLTDASGVLVLDVADASTETVYCLSSHCPRSNMLDCTDIGTLTFT